MLNQIAANLWELEWDVDRIVPGHGGIIATGGHDVLAHAFTWLGSSRL
ncbi:MAG: hypothetical protein HS113_15550 [Verrucomicrobiales bacterium]|nr:hypothetical protein [Verrucomicrobiales bacterium]